MELELPADVQQLLKDLLQGSMFYIRRDAAVKLGQLSTSSTLIVTSLIVTKELDPDEKVRSAADAALRLPVHQAVYQQNSKEIQKAFQTEREKLRGQRKMAFRARTGSDLRSVIACLCGIGAVTGYFFMRGLPSAARYAQPGNPYEEALLREANGFVMLGLIGLVIVGIMVVGLIYWSLQNR